MADTHFVVLLLGPPAVYAHEQPFQIKRRQIRSMLYYLACQREMISRAALALLFWPDELEEASRRHLREALSKLRAQLPHPDLLVTEQDRVGLNPELVNSDVLAFEDLYAQTARLCSQIPVDTPLPELSSPESAARRTVVALNPLSVWHTPSR